MKLFIFTVILYLGLTNLYAQDTETKKQLFPISITAMQESLSLPFVSSPIKRRYNPAFLIGTEYLLKEKSKYDLHLSGNLGYYYHKDWESALFSEIKFGYRYHVNRFSISPNIGLGYAYINSTKPTYQFENGQFTEAKRKGRSALQTSVSIIPSFKILNKENSPEIYLSYTFVAQFPNSEVKGFHQFTGLGFKFYPFKNK